MLMLMFMIDGGGAREVVFLSSFFYVDDVDLDLDVDLIEEEEENFGS